MHVLPIVLCCFCVLFNKTVIPKCDPDSLYSPEEARCLSSRTRVFTSLGMAYGLGFLVYFPNLNPMSYIHTLATLYFAKIDPCNHSFVSQILNNKKFCGSLPSGRLKSLLSIRRLSGFNPPSCANNACFSLGQYFETMLTSYLVSKCDNISNNDLVRVRVPNASILGIWNLGNSTVLVA